MCKKRKGMLLKKYDLERKKERNTYSLLKNNKKPFQCIKYGIAAAFIHFPFQFRQKFVHYLVMMLYETI